MATSPIYGWAEPDNTDLVKNGALAIRTLGNAIDTTMGTMVAKTIIDAKGDLIAGSAADTALRLAVGNNGETLVADSAAATGLRYSATPSASNPVLNSTFQVAQRGTSFTGVTSNQYTLDRWILWATAGSMSIYNSQQTTSDTTNLPNIQFCSRVGRTAANTATGTVAFLQSFETINSRPFSGKTVTMSFYARKGANFSATSNVLTSSLSTGTGTDQNYSSGYTGQVDNAQSNTLTATWQRFTQTVSVGATATELTTLFYFAPTGTAGAADYFEITGVQIDIGSVALPFRTYAATIQGELAACQRYYIRYAADTSNAYAILATAAYTASAAVLYAMISLPVELRTNTIAVETGGTVQYVDFAGGSGNVTVPTVAAAQQNPKLAFISWTVSAATLGRGAYLRANNSTTAYIALSAEL